MEVTKKILLSIYFSAFTVGAICFFRWIFLFFSRDPDKIKRKKTAKILLGSVVIAVLSIVVHFVVSVKQYTQTVDIAKLPTFKVTSDNLHDGVWDEKIGAKHGNISPMLSWDKVENARKYLVVMIDYDGNNWLHLVYLTDDTVLDEGAVTEKDGYVGPYPPSGTHNYTVYVFALNGDTYALDYKLDSGGTDFQKLTDQINFGVTTDYDKMSKVADLHTCVQNRIFCECPHGDDSRRDNIIAVGIVEGEYGKELEE